MTSTARAIAGITRPTDMATLRSSRFINCKMAFVLMRSRFFEAVFRRSVGLDWLGRVGMTELYLGAGVFRAVVREKPLAGRSMLMTLTAVLQLFFGSCVQKTQLPGN